MWIELFLQIMTGSIGSGITYVELVGSGTREWFLETVAEAACSLKEKWQRLSVGCSKLDGFLRGGFAVQGITEIAGESSSGKTQLCLQMALTVQYPVINGGLSGGWCFLLPFVACSETLPLCLIRHVMNICRKVEVCFHSFLTSCSAWRWSLSGPGCSNPPKKAPSTHWIGRKAGLNGVEERKVAALISNQNPFCLSSSL